MSLPPFQDLIRRALRTAAASRAEVPREEDEPTRRPPTRLNPFIRPGEPLTRRTLEDIRTRRLLPDPSLPSEFDDLDDLGDLGDFDDDPAPPPPPPPRPRIPFEFRNLDELFRQGQPINIGDSAQLYDALRRGQVVQLNRRVTIGVIDAATQDVFNFMMTSGQISPGTTFDVILSGGPRPGETLARHPSASRFVQLIVNPLTLHELLNRIENSQEETDAADLEPNDYLFINGSIQMVFNGGSVMGFGYSSLVVEEFEGSVNGYYIYIPPDGDCIYSCLRKIYGPSCFDRDEDDEDQRITWTETTLDSMNEDLISAGRRPFIILHQFMETGSMVPYLNMQDHPNAHCCVIAFDEDIGSGHCIHIAPTPGTPSEWKRVDRTVSKVLKVKPKQYALDKSEFMFCTPQGMVQNWQKYVCLLYTSPSPRDATLSRMPSSA